MLLIFSYFSSAAYMRYLSSIWSETEWKFDIWLLHLGQIEVLALTHLVLYCSGLESFTSPCSTHLSYLLLYHCNNATNCRRKNLPELLFKKLAYWLIARQSQSPTTSNFYTLPQLLDGSYKLWIYNQEGVSGRLSEMWWIVVLNVTTCKKRL